MSKQLTHTSQNSDTVIEILKELGLTTSEHTIFLTLLRGGSRQAGTLAKQSEIARPHAYEILDRLVGRGLVSVHEKNGVKHFSALSLDELLLLFQRKESALAEKRKQLIEVISSLQETDNNFWADPKTKSYTGTEARARLFQELNRECSDSGFVFCSAEKSSLFEGLTPSRQQLFHLSQIVPSSLKIVLFSSKRSSLEDVEVLSLSNLVPYLGEFPVEMIVQSSRVTLIGEKAKAPCAITIDQPALAECLRLICEPVFRRYKDGNDTSVLKQVA